MTHADMDDRLAAAMMETARAERRRAAERDGRSAGGIAQCQRAGAAGRKPTAAGQVAMRLVASAPDLRADEIAARSGLSASRVRAIMRERRGTMRPGPRPGEGGARRTQASIEAERMLMAGSSAREAAKATGLSRSQAQRIAKSVRDRAADGAAQALEPQVADPGSPMPDAPRKAPQRAAEREDA